ncbi:hypothetical protein J0910_30215 [Nocardiopsis sp. CNT-189]|uniref:DUF6879 family protein n=1 Tax=Nocardiopsis oceanisediminis TaxID=2816862 RepID=UPI003B388B39
MTDPAALRLDPSRGVRLAHREYKEEFRRHDSEVRDHKSWKLERRQHFLEPNDPSWEAFHRGEWEESLRLLEDRRGALSEAVADEEERGNPFHRVRIVKEPLTPYLRWELRYLRLQAECGRPVRVLGHEAVLPLEPAGPLPEAVVLGGRILYQVVYSDEGLSDGAIRFTDPEIVQRWEGLIGELYSSGEDVVSYTDRHMPGLSPPPGRGR